MSGLQIVGVFMKIGLIGAENSHTISFCEAINAARKFPGYEITHVYGGDSAEACAKLVAKYGLIECAGEDEIISACDAFVLTYRRGSEHYIPAMKVLRAGKPLYNDKPFTVSADKALELTEYAAKNGVLLCGGSTIKSQPEIDALKDRVAPGSTVVVGYTADIGSEYDGFWFYGIHTVETFARLMGANYKSVSACVSGKSVIASVNYGDRRGVIVNSPDAKDFYVSLMNGGDSETFIIPPGDADIAPAQFINMLETGKPPYDYRFYYDCVRLMADIMASAGI